ncbi:hypothetical protein [Pleionea sp. CnH1-48]|uniref:hypothetical protein n=1 Tax=Pleionea sp. CnH1-48 TaxID=2954494 RepID=UPI0020969134|nr:hypothetical protein [Pleionea sp. CnH1-48]MCO7226615.1 hypothetical protein [Pleionea sp. CnH1-48]
MVRKLFRLFVLLLLLVATTAFYIWFELQKGISKAVETLPDKYVLTYDYHYINHEGQLIIERPRLFHLDFGDLAYANRMIVQLERWQDYHKLDDKLTLLQYPAKGEISLQRLVLHGDKIKPATDFLYSLKLSKLIFQGCESVSTLTAADFESLDLLSIDSNLTLNYHYNVLGSSLELSSKGEFDSLFSYEFDISLRDIHPGDPVSPYLVSSQWVMIDPDILSKRDQFCAQKTGMSPQDFAQKHHSDLLEHLKEQGIIVSEQFVSSYKAFAADKQSLAFTAKPSTGIRLSSFANKSYSELLDALNLTVHFNGKEVTPIVAAIDFMQQPKVKEVDPKEQQRRALERKRIQRPSVSRLQSFVQRKVELILQNGDSYKGTILEVNGRNLRLKIRIRRGNIERNFKPDDIRSVLLLD